MSLIKNVLGHFSSATKYLGSLWQQINATLKSKWPTQHKKLCLYARLTRLDKPIGILLLLWPTLWGLWFAAEGPPYGSVFIVFCLGVLLMRSAGCVLNDIADRQIDKHINRTEARPLTNGEIGAKEALLIAIALIFIAFLLVLTMNTFTVQLAFVAVLLAGVYPFMKRHTYLPQFVLGLAFGWAIPMGFAAQTGAIPELAWILLIANVLWSVVYHTMYAMVDREDDLKIGVKSTAILLDDADRFIIAIIQFMVIFTLIMAGKRAEMGGLYYLGLFVGCGFFIYQLCLIWQRQKENCFKAFLNNNWFGFTVFIGIMLDYLMR